MPGFDGTGPLGKGSMTGRGMGYCVVELPAGNSSWPRGEPGDHHSAQATESDEFRKEAMQMFAGGQVGPYGWSPMMGESVGRRSWQRIPGFINPVLGPGSWGGLPYAPVTYPIFPPYGPWPGYGGGWGGFGCRRGWAWRFPFGRGRGRGWRRFDW